MSRWCDHIALTPDLEERFNAIMDQDDDDEMLEQLGELTNDVYDDKSVLRNEMNHLWEDVHRIVNDDDTEEYPEFGAGEGPLRAIIHDDDLLVDDHRTLTYIGVDEVVALAEALKGVTADRMRERFEALRERLPRYSNVGETNEERDEWFTMVWEEFDGLREFYKKAAAARLPVICTISH